MKKYPITLTIAGSDSCGGAGIQADIKAISATGSYAASVITAVTAQNTLGVDAIHPVPCEMIAAQIESVMTDLDVNAVKIGMLNSDETVRTVANTLKRFDITDIVLDPVMVSTSGHRLIAESAIEELVTSLIPMARVITPNIPEAEVLSGMKISGEKDFKEIARKLSLNGKVSVWMKAGHLASEILTDIFYNAEDNIFIEMEAPKINTQNTHGTGCTLSSALASYLAQGLSLNDAVRAAKDYLDRAILSGADYICGHGHGPVNHFWSINAV